MSNDDDTDKSFDPTPEKLRKAREKGEIAKSADLSVVAGYAGLVLGLIIAGQSGIFDFGTALMILIDQSDQISNLVFDGSPSAPFGGFFAKIALSLAPIFVLPAVAVIVTIIAQRAFVVAPTKLKPKLSRLSIISNAKNKFGRSGLFEFAKSFSKLLIYSFCLGLFLRANLPDIVAASSVDLRLSATLMMTLLIRFLFIVVAVSLVIGGIDYLWQYHEHQRKNRMSRKEIQDETKDSEGDPHMKNQRRQRGQQIAMNQMMADVPDADVIIVNPTHYAVALKWARTPGTAPVCVAKGVDEIAAAIRKSAQESGVPIHSDPPTARALHASVEIGNEIPEDQFRAVAAAIRFAEAMRLKAKAQI